MVLKKRPKQSKSYHKKPRIQLRVSEEGLGYLDKVAQAMGVSRGEALERMAFAELLRLSVEGP